MSAVSRLLNLAEMLLYPIRMMVLLLMMRTSIIECPLVVIPEGRTLVVTSFGAALRSVLILSAVH